MKITAALIILLAVAIFFSWQGAARAGNGNLWDNESPMTKFLADHYQMDPIVVISLGQRMTFPDDVSVAIYLAKIVDIPPLQLLDPRLNKKSWADIALKLKIDPALIFTPLEKYEGIPGAFRHAYGEYAKHLRNPDYAMVLYDKEYRNLVQLKLMVDAFKLRPLAVMQSVDRGASYADLILEQLRAREQE